MQDTLEASAPQARALVLDWLASQQQAMQDLLQKVVNIDSGSRDEAGVTAVAHALAERLQAAGVPVQFEAVPGYGVLLHAQVNAAGEGAPIVLMGHMDTVFPEGTPIKVRREGDRYWAPGIADNCCGLRCLLETIRAFEETGVETEGDIWFVGTVGEEGLGDLRGVRALFAENKDIDGFISIERFQSLTQPGKILSLSFWQDEASVQAWRQRDAQMSGWDEGKCASAGATRRIDLP